MNADEFRAAAEGDAATELDRLGSSKRLVALTGASLDDETVLRVAAASEAAAADVFEDWSADASGHAAETFASFAERERDHYERVIAELDEDVRKTTESSSAAHQNAERSEDVAADPGAVHEHLRELDDPVERAGAVVGRGLVADRTLMQFVSYFVNQGDETRADLFRDLRSETGNDTDAAVDLLAGLVDGDADWERASEAAVEVVDVAYEEYVDALGGMGVDAKSVC